MKKSFTARLSDTGYLIKNSFTLIGHDKDILHPTINMLIYNMLILLSLAFTIFAFYTNPLILAISIPALILLSIYKYFFEARQKAIQSWIVYVAATGGDTDYTGGKKHIHDSRWSLRGIAVIDFFVGIAQSNKDNKKNVLTAILFRALEEVWDLLENYLIPCVVIEKKRIRDSIGELKALKRNIPASLVGVFGVDFAGSVLLSITNLPIFLLFVIGVYIAWAYQVFLPLLIILIFAIFVHMLVRVFVDMLKTIYFTLMYTAINKPQNLSAKMRAEITQYLKFQ